ncbi:hypothetical protein LRS56_13060 [Pseudomonas poae]|nr:hypothetical protein LRS56_13060 [Pseudomonas poae]
MSTRLKLASDIPQPREVRGEIKGTIGTHDFETAVGKASAYQEYIEITLIDKHDDGSAEEVYIRFPDDVPLNTALPLTGIKSREAWISFKTLTNPFAVQCKHATLRIDTLVISPFEVKGALYGDEANPNVVHPVNITFELKA